MELPSANTISPSRNFTLGPDEDFSVALTPTITSSLTQSPWKFGVPFDTSANCEKAKIPEPESFSKDTLSLPAVTQSNMPRRASCPNFVIPEFNFVPQENKRMLSSKRPSIHEIVSQGFVSKFNAADTKLKPPPSPISEKPEFSFTSVEEQQNVVNQSTGTNLHSDQAVKVAEIQTVQKKSGFFASSVSSLFSARQVDNSTSSFTPNNQTDSVSSPPGKKKSYLMRRASAISNADMNAIAPTSL